MEKLIMNHTYLFKPLSTIDDNVVQARVENITETSYEIKYKNTINGIWYLKTQFENKYSMIEDITDNLRSKYYVDKER